MKYCILFSVFQFVFLMGQSQIVRPVPSSQMLHQVKKLKVLGSVLYIAAHPDDENTRLIAHLANDEQFRAGYLSLTRGDGGQNLIGNEQGIDLGLIRTQELLAARRIDGGEQFFTRAVDFGYSKSPEETFEKWNQETILSDVVWVIRKFQPDVIIARFPEDGRGGHGHHTASGILARLGFEAAADPNRFPEQLKAGVGVWQAKRLLWNTFNFGSTNTIDSNQFKVEVNHYLPLIGQSVGELAGESRSQHKSQGFGVSRQRGGAFEYFTLVKGDKPTGSLMDGVNTRWSKIAGAKDVEPMIDAIQAKFDHENPAASLADLQKLRQRLQQLKPSDGWAKWKTEEVEKLMLLCAGIYGEATLAQPAIIAGDSVAVRLNLVNRSNIQCNLVSVKMDGIDTVFNKPLANNQPFNTTLKPVFSEPVMKTQPYWLVKMPDNGMFYIPDQQLVGQGQNKPLSAKLMIAINGQLLNWELPLQYRYVDPVKAEQYQPVFMSDAFLLHQETDILLFRKNQPGAKEISINVKSLKPFSAREPGFELKSEAGEFKNFQAFPSVDWQTGYDKSFSIKIPNYLANSTKEQDLLELSFKPEGPQSSLAYQNGRHMIEYDHIPTQTWHFKQKIKVLHIDLQTVGKNIGYISGAGDRVPEALKAMGYQVTLLTDADLTIGKLAGFDAIITGVRAYNVNANLSNVHPVLMDYVKKGGNLIVQYNTNSFIGPVNAKIAPYSMTIGRTRITNEKAPARLLIPEHPALNHPNKINEHDFDGWQQERSIYHAERFDSAHFQAPLGFADKDEPMHNGSLVIAPYGKGNFVYTGLVFFRQLPAGVPGAYRLLANLIGLPKNDTP